MEDHLLYMNTLARSFKYDTIVAKELLSYFGDVRLIFREKKKSLINLLGTKYILQIETLLDKESFCNAEKDIKQASNYGFELVTIDNPAYPKRLKECPDSPIVLFKKGQCNLNGSRYISIVGTRFSSPYGEKNCEKIVEHLYNCSPKPIIISGMALGIDTCAHKSALQNGLKTIAVMGTCYNTIYPSSNTSLSDRICESGCIITEYGDDYPILPFNFLRRNRIIAGMADGVILCESKEKGGGMVTAKVGFDYNRAVFALPGRLDDKSYKGCNKLIERQIATIINDYSTITRTLGWRVVHKQSSSSTTEDVALAKDKKGIIQLIKQEGELNIYEIAEILHISLGDIAQLLLEMEVSGEVYRLPSNKYSI